MSRQRNWVFLLLLSLVLSACAANQASSTGSSPADEANPAITQAPTLNSTQQAKEQPVSKVANACTVTEPIWAKPPKDAAIPDPPVYGYYYLNEDRSIWASAGWANGEDYRAYAGKKGIKVGWFRPAGAELEITGRRLDGKADPLVAEVPCCYPTQFQATGLFFPTEGCWEVKAEAAESVISFVVLIEP